MIGASSSVKDLASHTPRYNLLVEEIYKYYKGGKDPEVFDTIKSLVQISFNDGLLCSLDYCYLTGLLEGRLPDGLV